MTNYHNSGRKLLKELPFEVVDEDENTADPTRPKLVFVGPKRYALPEVYKLRGLDIYNFEARPDDVYLVGYRRSGTTLHSEMVWQIVNDLDYEGASKNFIDYRFPHIDFSLFGVMQGMQNILKSKDVTADALEIAKKYGELTLEGLAERKGRRFIKSHLPLSLLPPHIFEIGAKVIYCARNPRDVLVSAHYAANFFQFNKSLDFKKMFDNFKKDLVVYSPYFEHVKEAWNRRNDKNILFLFYEDTMKDKRQTIQKVANFLGKNLSNDQIDSLEDYLKFEKFKNNKSVNCDHLIKVGFAKDNGLFMRKGKPGGWRELFDKDMKEEFDQMMEEKLKGTDLKFPEI